MDQNGNPLPDDSLSWVMVRDNVTGLTWQKETALNTYTFQQALSYCENLTLGGYSDWRIPTVKELSFIIDRARDNPSINISYYPDTIVSEYYWTSTDFTDPAIPNFVWLVHFSVGYTNNSGNKSSGNFYVRAVRGEQTSNSFFDNGDGTVTDHNTGLMWQQDTAPGTYNWQQALSYCENLTLADYNDWRLPDVNELQSLVEYSRLNPAIDPVFSNTVSTLSFGYWSSTSTPFYPEYAWCVYFYDGLVGDDPKAWTGWYVRAVRAGQCGSFDDSDSDGILDCLDNCPNHPNGPSLGTCTSGPREKISVATCTSNADCDPNGFCSMNQEDIYPPGGNGIGDACDCEGNFNCDQNVDGLDAAKFKEDFGRSSIFNPCPACL
jgi:hypothetical protein